jgi:hypothetical protein
MPARNWRKIESLSGIVSPGLLGSFVLLGIFPLIAKKIVDLVKARKVYAGWKKPAKFRAQSGGDRCRRGGLGDFLHRRRGQSQGDAGRETQDGWRLPEYRLRALQGADPLGQAAVADGR